MVKNSNDPGDRLLSAFYFVRTLQILLHLFFIIILYDQPDVPFYRWENRDSEKLNAFHKVTQLMDTHMDWLQSPHSPF